MAFGTLWIGLIITCLSFNAYGFIEAIRAPLYQHNLTEKDLSPHRRSYVFLTPNEHNPRLALPALKKTEFGVYISVGTERGFMHAAASNATHLLLLDSDRQIVLQNRMTILILKLSQGDPEKFRELRLNSFKLEDYLSNRNKIRLLNQEESWGRSLADTRWWYENTERSKLDQFWRKKPLWGEAFDQLHYVYEPELFQKLYQMAKDGKIQAGLTDLRDTQATAKIAAELAQLKLPISALDISNTWEERYMGPEKTLNALATFGPAALDSTIVLITSPSQYVDAEKDPHHFWTYRASYYSNLFQHKFLVTVDSFLGHFPNINRACPDLLVR